MKKLFVVFVILVSIGATSAQADTGGAILGGIAGGVIGSRFGGGNGNTIATGVGAVIGTMVGDRMTSSQPVVQRAVYRPQPVVYNTVATSTSGQQAGWGSSSCSSRYGNDEELYRECQIGAAKKAAASRSEELRAARDYGGGSVSAW